MKLSVLPLPVLLWLVCASLCAAQIPEFNVTISPADLSALTHRNPFSEDYLPATFEYRGMVWEDAKIRYKGRSTRFFPKKSFRIRFPANHLFAGARDLNLHGMYLDESAMREKLSWDLFADLGALAPRASYARLAMNGKPQGLYLAVDKVDKHFLLNRQRAAGPLYEAGGYFALADMTVQDTALLKQYYPKENGDRDDYGDLQRLLREINGAPDTAFAEVVDRLFDMQSVYRWLAVNILTMMGDSYTKNYFLYRDPTRTDRQWTVIPWDYDMTFGLSGDPAVEYPKSLLNEGFAYTFPALSGPDNVLKDRIWKTPALREHLRRYVDTLLETVFTEERMNRRIDSLRALIGPDVAADSGKRGTEQDFLDHAGALKYFVMARRQYLLQMFVNAPPPAGEFDMATLPVTRTDTAYHFMGPDGRLMATIRFSGRMKLDSIRVEANGGLLPPGVDSVQNRRYVARFLQITPFPANARFTASIEWMYHDVSSKDREVPPVITDERALRCFLHTKKSLIQLPARINTVANTVTIDAITQKECAGDSTYFVLALP